MMLKKRDEKSSGMSWTKVCWCSFHFIQLLEKVVDCAAPLPPTFPIILTMNLISLVNTDIALGQQSPVPTFHQGIHTKGDSLSLSTGGWALQMVIHKN